MQEAAKTKSQNALTNGDFRTGQSGWQTEGEVRFLPGTPASKPRVRLGPGASAMRQRHRVTGLQTLWFGANLAPEPTTLTGRVRAACFDSKNQLLLEALTESSAYASVYLKTHARTAYIVLSLEKTASS